MTRNQRIAFLALAALVAAASFVLVPGSGDEEQAATPASAESATPQAADDSTASGGQVTPKPRPTVPVLTAEKVTRLQVTKGDTVRFAVRSQTDDEIHVHGYDLSQPAPAGKTVRMSFVAGIEGIFEIELEHAGAPIAALEVRP